MNSINLLHDWIGPEGPWANGQCMDFLYNKDNYERSSYAVGNKPNPYQFEQWRHKFTYPKIYPLLDHAQIDYTVMSVANATYETRGIYELTPLLKPYQWADGAFEHMSNQAKDLHRNGNMHILINDIYEGYSNQSYDFFAALHREIELHQLVAARIHYLSLNSMSNLCYRDWCNTNGIRNPISIISVYIFEKHIAIPPRTKSKHYILLNRTPTLIRQALVYELWRRGLLKYGHVSMPSADSVTDEKFDKDLVSSHFNIDTSLWNEFLGELPFVVDSDDFTRQDCTDKTILDYYAESCFSIVVEQTYDNTDNIKFTEKTFRAITTNSIPLFFNAAGTHNAFTRELGYQTYGYEGYDNIVDVNHRFNLFVDNIENICKTPLNTLIDDIALINHHNQTLIKSRATIELKTKMLQLIGKVNG